MIRLLASSVALLGLLCLAVAAGASHQSNSCTDCADHKEWPHIDGIIKKAGDGSVRYTGTSKSDELLGHHGSDVLRGGDASDVLWGDWDPSGQPATQHDVIYGGTGSDFIYGSHGINTIYGGAGNDAISVHYGRGVVDCGAGRDIYHVARSRKKGYKFKNCEKVDYRPEKVRGGGLKPLP